MINPITKTDYPDPDVIRVGDTFYMVSTTMYFFPGGEILLPQRPTPSDVAAAVAYLLEAPAVTGQTIAVDSGQSLLDR